MMKDISTIIIVILVLLARIPVTGQIIDLESDLILNLPLNGNTVDQSGFNVPSSVIGAELTSDRYGNSNSAYLFDGTGDCINLNNDNPLITARIFSICAWVKINGTSYSETGANNLFEQRDNESEAVSAKSTILFNAEKYGIVSLQLRSSNTSNGNIHVYSCEFDDKDEWHHYAATLDSERNVIIYIDAVPYCFGVFPENGDFVTSIDHVYLGSHHYRGVIKGALNGMIDEVYIYNRALNACEIEALYLGTSTQER